MNEDMDVAAVGVSVEGGIMTSPAVSATLTASAPPPFLSKTYDMVDDPATDAIVSWGPGNNSFVVWNVPEFSRDLLPKHFKHNNFSSFVRQLNTYGFRKVDPDKWEFANEGFLKGQKHLLKSINRRKPSNAHTQQQQQPNAPSGAVGACVEVGKFGLEEEIERLKRDKNVLMQELVRLRQQQQGTDLQLQTLTQRLQGMEQRQQQMMSFLAKAMQSPGFLAQLVQQHDSSRRVVGVVGKKRRLPKQENNLDGEISASQDGQIIKYQPLMTEAVKSLLMQILKCESSSMLETRANSDGFLIENFSSHDGLRASENRNSCFTLKEFPAPCLPSSSCFPAIHPSSAGISDMPAPSKFPGIDLLSVVPETMSSSSTSMSAHESTKIPGIMPNDGSLDIAVDSLVPLVPDMFLGQLVDDSIPIETENFSINSGIGIPTEDDSKLPCINDSFWEQFLVDSSLSSDVAQEVDSSIQETSDMHPEMETVWDSTQHMQHLTERMGLLSPEAKT
ncbi:heat stress transcription factor A-1-like [Phalaenopsis equestris]|uniref:heat stress transcription factor A-1-like n=1 Tax=Phalaenopsis equestris TaxID=78828 RepID=UPI0009E37396|nr:heat stress transcription factor A-1-like [Phalaenopsis equestris]